MDWSEGCGHADEERRSADQRAPRSSRDRRALFVVGDGYAPIGWGKRWAGAGGLSDESGIHNRIHDRKTRVGDFRSKARHAGRRGLRAGLDGERTRRPCLAREARASAAAVGCARTSATDRPGRPTHGGVYV